MAAGTLTLHLRDRRGRRVALLEAGQQIVAVVVLLLSIRRRLAVPSAAGAAMALAQGAAGVLLLGAIVRELTGHESHRVSWTNLLAGVLLGLEWLDRYQHGGKVVSPVLLTALTSILIGLAHGRVRGLRERRRQISMDGETLDFRYLYRHFRVAWREVEEIVEEKAALRLVTRAGRRHTIRFARLEDGARIAGAVVEQARAAGVRVRSSRPPP
jgi:hypothetical protein